MFFRKEYSKISKSKVIPSIRASSKRAFIGSPWLPARAQRRLPLLVGGALLLLNAVAWGFYIWPAFHGPA
jgi:hypothetical protein